MSDPAPPPVASPVSAPAEDRVMPGVVYALYLLGLATGLTILIGLIVAYVARDGAGPKAATHYTFLIRSFWLSIGWFLIGAVLVVFGAPLSIVLVGLPLLITGVLIFAAIGTWFAVRCIVGLVYLARDEAYPRPRTWLI